MSPSPEVSDRYVFIPTDKVIKNFEKFGWRPVSAVQTNSKEENDYGAHTIKFSRKEGRFEVDEYVEEIVYTSSHNRSIKVQMNMGVYHCFCENQCVAQDSNFMEFSHKHVGFEYEEIEKIVKEAIKQFSVLSSKISEYKTIELTEIKMNKFAYVAKNAHWGEDSKVLEELLLNIRRSEDAGNNLWSIFNRI